MTGKKKIQYTAVALMFIGVAVGFVFLMGSMNGAASTQLSEKVAKFIGENLLQMELEGWRLDKVNTIIRKTAHFVMYGGLGMVLFLVAYGFIHKVFPSMIVGGVLAMLVSVADEVNQLGVAGRSGSKMDIIIDGAGVATAVLFVGILTAITKGLDLHHQKHSKR